MGMLDKICDFGGTCLALTRDAPWESDPGESSADVTRTAANESSWGKCWGSSPTLPLSPAPTTGTTAVSIIHSVLLRIHRGDTSVITTGYAHCDEDWYRDRKMSLGIRCVSLWRRIESLCPAPVRHAISRSAHLYSPASMRNLNEPLDPVK